MVNDRYDKAGNVYILVGIALLGATVLYYFPALAMGTLGWILVNIGLRRQGKPSLAYYVKTILRNFMR